MVPEDIYSRDQKTAQQPAAQQPGVPDIYSKYQAPSSAPAAPGFGSRLYENFVGPLVNYIATTRTIPKKHVEIWSNGWISGARPNGIGRERRHYQRLHGRQRQGAKCAQNRRYRACRATGAGHDSIHRTACRTS